LPITFSFYLSELVLCCEQISELGEDLSDDLSCEDLFLGRPAVDLVRLDVDSGLDVLSIKRLHVHVEEDVARRVLEVEDRSDLSRDDHSNEISWSARLYHPLRLFVQMVVEDQLLLIDLLL